MCCITLWTQQLQEVDNCILENGGYQSFKRVQYATWSVVTNFFSFLEIIKPSTQQLREITKMNPYTKKSLNKMVLLNEDIMTIDHIAFEKIAMHFHVTIEWIDTISFLFLSREFLLSQPLWNPIMLCEKLKCDIMTITEDISSIRTIIF